MYMYLYMNMYLYLYLNMNMYMYLYMYMIMYLITVVIIKSMRPAHERVNALPFFGKISNRHFFKKNFNIFLFFRLTIRRVGFIF